MKTSPRWVPLATLVLLGSLTAAPAVSYAGQQPAPDNTKMNKDNTKPSADQQKMNPNDRTITQKIRKAIHDDSSLSTYGHNVKIITQDGKVTLRGPVRSDEEKSSIEAKAVEAAGQGNVTNDLNVAPSK